MSVLEFIASLKWPVVVLVLLGYGSRTMKKHPNLRKWIAAYVEKRDVRGKMGPAEFEAITPATSAIVRAAVASDVELAAIAGEQTSTPDTSVLRREVVEDLLRSSAQWGYEMAQIGMRTPPIRTSGGAATAVRRFCSGWALLPWRQGWPRRPRSERLRKGPCAQDWAKPSVAITRRSKRRSFEVAARELQHFELAGHHAPASRSR